MSLESKISKNVFQGNGTTKTFSFTFRVWKEDQVLVYVGIGDETEIDVTSSCSITLSENGGTVTFPTAPAVGMTIVITRNMPFIQEDQYITGARFDPHEIEDRLDQDCAERQQLLDGVERAVKVPNTSDKTPEQFVQQLFTARDEAQEAASAAQAAQTAAESCRDEACECASEAAATLENAVTVIKQQEQASVEVVKNEGDTQAKRLEDIATTILISAASFNKIVSVKLTSAITNGETYTLPESLAYLVGRSQLLVSGNGVWFYKGFQYEEVGTDGVASTQIKFLQDLAVDDVLTFTLLANRVNVLTATNSGLINDADGYLKLNVDGQTVLINASGQVYVPVMVGTTADKAGTAGLAPAPSAGEQDKFLKANGTWDFPLNIRAYNPIKSEENDTVPNWLKLGSGVFFYNNYYLINQPTQYGFLISIAGNGNIFQLWRDGGTGRVYYRAGNGYVWAKNFTDFADQKDVMPVGSVYVQFSGQSAPADIFGGTWSNISSTYSGRFFRAEGGSAASFGNGQTDAAPEIYGKASHVETYKSRSASYAFRYEGVLTNNQIGYGEDFGVASLVFRASLANAAYGRAEEVRPVNSTIRIWKRTA